MFIKLEDNMNEEDLLKELTIQLNNKGIVFIIKLLQKVCADKIQEVNMSALGFLFIPKENVDKNYINSEIIK